NLALEKKGLTLPKPLKTGTTIAGLIFKVVFAGGDSPIVSTITTLINISVIFVFYLCIHLKENDNNKQENHQCYGLEESPIK
ncbi:8904_t:CDS:2, partial [Entrophospora sp. SA101]